MAFIFLPSPGLRIIMSPSVGFQKQIEYLSGKGLHFLLSLLLPSSRVVCYLLLGLACGRVAKSTVCYIQPVASLPCCVPVGVLGCKAGTTSTTGATLLTMCRDVGIGWL